MNLDELNKIAIKMVAPGKGILAAEESTGTIQKRFDKIGVPNTEENRRDYRELLFRTEKAMREHISGVILFDETIRQKAKDGTPLVKLIADAGAVPGIKVDAGAKPLAGAPNDTITEGLDGLRERFVEYHKLGARFAKWRGVYEIGAGRPSHDAIHANAHALARYAALAQENGIVPIVEPELLMDGDHTIEACEGVTEWILKEVFQELDPQTQHDRAGQEMREAEFHRGSRRAHRQGAETLRAGRGAGDRLPVGRPVGRGSHRASLRHERHWQSSLVSDLLLWPRPAGRTPGRLGRQARECRQGAGRLCPSRADEFARRTGQVEPGRRKKGGLV